MFKYDEHTATKKAFELAEKAIEAGFLGAGMDGQTAGEYVIAFMNAIVDGLTEKNAGPNQLDE